MRGLSQASIQNCATCFEAEARCLLTAAAAGPRIFPAMALAPDSHMLRSGFFFVHGLATLKPPYAPERRACGNAMGQLKMP